MLNFNTAREYLYYLTQLGCAIALTLHVMYYYAKLH
jgi:hypothetical protein